MLVGPIGQNILAEFDDVGLPGIVGAKRRREPRRADIPKGSYRATGTRLLDRREWFWGWFWYSPFADKPDPASQ